MPDDTDITPAAKAATRKVIKGWAVETTQDKLDVLIRFFGGGTLIIRGQMGGQLVVGVSPPNGPQNLYEVARDINHELGLPWTDPRTGVTHEPPAKAVLDTEGDRPAPVVVTECPCGHGDAPWHFPRHGICTVGMERKVKK